MRCGTHLYAGEHVSRRPCDGEEVAYNGRVQAGRDAGSVGYAQLVRDAADGDREAMERLLMHAQEVAYRFSVLICGHPEDAEDVMQDALLKTYQHVSQIADPDAFRTWLYSTVRNTCLMKRRRRVGEPAHLVSIEQGARSVDGELTPVEVADSARGPYEQLQNAWAGERLQRALQALPDGYRAIVVMREIEGLTTREVAEITGLSEANVKQRLHRARVLLRQTLEPS